MTVRLRSNIFTKLRHDENLGQPMARESWRLVFHVFSVSNTAFHIATSRLGETPQSSDRSSVEHTIKGILDKYQVIVYNRPRISGLRSILEQRT